MIIYKTINKLNGKFYIGQDRYNNPLYLGSGLLLERAFDKYGKENFEKKIIENCKSLIELNQREIFWIKELNSTNPDIGYNIAIGGTGGDTISHHPRRIEISKNISKRNINRYKDKTQHPSFGKIQSKASNKKRSKALLGIKRSNETKRKQSIAASGENNSAYGKKWVHDKILKKNKLIFKEEYNEYIEKGWTSGMLTKSEKYDG